MGRIRREGRRRVWSGHGVIELGLDYYQDGESGRGDQEIAPALDFRRSHFYHNIPQDKAGSTYSFRRDTALCHGTVASWPPRTERQHGPSSRACPTPPELHFLGRGALGGCKWLMCSGSHNLHLYTWVITLFTISWQQVHDRHWDRTSTAEDY